MVIATFGRARLLRRALEALAAQDAGPDSFEVVVAVDGPDQDTLAVLQETARGCLRLQWVQLSRRGGPAVARNAALRLATGAIIAITDDDCIPAPGWVSALTAAFRKDPALGVVIGKTTTDRTRLTPFSHYVENLDGATHQTCNIGYRRTLLDRLDGFDERFPYSHEDTDLFLRAQPITEVRFVPEALVEHPPRETTVREFARSARRFEGDFIFAEKHPAVYRQRHGGKGPLAAVLWDVGVKHVARRALTESRWLARCPGMYLRFLAALALFELTLVACVVGYRRRPPVAAREGLAVDSVGAGR